MAPNTGTTKTVGTAKMVILGDAAVGKSSIVLRFTRNSFSPYGESTIGAAFFTTTIETETSLIKTELWDTAGQERYGALAPMFYRNANAALVVYDITSYHSFERAKKWVAQLRSQRECPLIALIGNKVDLEQMRQISNDEAKQYASEQHIFFVESSARESINIQEPFRWLADELVHQASNPIPGATTSSQPIVIEPNKPESGGCC